MLIYLSNEHAEWMRDVPVRHMLILRYIFFHHKINCSRIVLQFLNFITKHTLPRTPHIFRTAHFFVELGFKIPDIDWCHDGDGSDKSGGESNVAVGGDFALTVTLSGCGGYGDKWAVKARVQRRRRDSRADGGAEWRPDLCGLVVGPIIRAVARRTAIDHRRWRGVSSCPLTS